MSRFNHPTLTITVLDEAEPKSKVHLESVSIKQQHFGNCENGYTPNNPAKFVVGWWTCKMTNGTEIGLFFEILEIY